jgi:hypothetical protein
VSDAVQPLWLEAPVSVHAKDDGRLLGLIKQQWLESGGVYGHRKIATLEQLGWVDTMMSRIASAFLFVAFVQCAFAQRDQATGNQKYPTTYSAYNLMSPEHAFYDGIERDRHAR